MKQGRTLVVGDIHGNYKGFLQALERSKFNNELDTLISIGDVVDGHCDSYEVVEQLLSIKNLIAIKGNHDDWFNQWLETGENPVNWQQGQLATGKSYLKNLNPSASWYTFDLDEGGYEETLQVKDIPKSHIEFFSQQLPFYQDKDNNLFVHGGFNRHFPIETQLEYTLWWNRDLWKAALSHEAMSRGMLDEKPKFRMVGDFKEVFIGHTQTQFWDVDIPMNAANIWNVDTGGGWFGYITIMDINTKEFWQSDDAKSLYPEFKGRG